MAALNPNATLYSVHDVPCSQTLILANPNLPNNSKFYVLQVVSPTSEPLQYALFTRWGRLGMVGQWALMLHPSLESAVAAYHKKIAEKKGTGYCEPEGAPI